LALARIRAGVELGAFQLATDKSVEVLVLAWLTSSPKKLVVYPAGSTHYTVAVGHRSDSE
jgi:hypothetical protein